MRDGSEYPHSTYDQAEIHEPSQKEFEVFKAIQNIPRGNATLKRCFALIFLEASFNELSFLR